MKSSRYAWGFVIVVVMCLVPAFLVSRNGNDPDLSGEEAPFSSLAMPPRSVTASMFLDGGSISVRVVDAKGGIFDFAFPFAYHAGAGTAYSKAYHGAEHSSEPGAIAMGNPKRAKELALLLLDRYADKNDRFTMGSYYALAEREPPLSVKLYHGIRSKFR